MTLMISIVLVCGLIAYLAGSIPFGLIICRIKNVDIRKTGSGNIGATNVFRSVGKGPGAATFALDFLKGYLPVILLPALLADSLSETASQALKVACGCMAILGHNWPVFLRFKGGKGVATSAGVLMAIAPSALGVGLLCWAVVFFSTGYVSLASIAAGAVIPVFAWFTRGDGAFLIPMALTAFGITAIARHKSNILRLVKGRENRASFAKRNRKGNTP